jgi:ubiquinone/menaquinone biosynthesis C-methylase UbiE
MLEGTFLNPAKVIETLPLEEGMKVAEFGSGTGLFSLKLSEKVAKEGKVFSIDVQKDALESLRARAKMEGAYNLETVWADLERPGSTKMEDGSLDAVLLPNMLFQSQKKEEILKEAFRILRTGCMMLVVDWYPEKAIFGQAMGWPAKPEDMRATAERAGFTFQQEIQTGSVYHYGLMFRK